MMGAKFLIVGLRSYRYAREGGYNYPSDNGLSLKTSYELIFSLI